MHNQVNDSKNNKKYNLINTQIIIALMATQFIAFFYYGGFLAIFPFILEYFQYNEIQVVENWAFIFSFGLIIGFLTRMPMGIVADKLSRRKSLILGTVICSLSVTLLLFTTDVIILALILGAIRTGTHLFPLLTRGYVNEIKEEKHGRINGFMLISANIAGFLSPIILTLILNVSFQLLIIFANIILYGVLIFLLMKVPPKTERKEYKVKEIVFKSLIELAKLKKAILVIFLIGLINGIYNYMRVPYALYVLHLTQEETSLIIGFISLSNIVFILISGELINKMGIRKMIFLGLTVILVGTILIISFPLNIIAFTLGQFFLGGGILFVINTTVTLVTLRASAITASTSFGGVSSFFFLGSALIPYIAKELYVIESIYPYYLIVILTFFFYIIFFILRIQKKRNLSNGSTT